MTIFCDVDGTLLDSSARHEQLLRDLIREEGLTWPQQAPDYLAYKADGHSTFAWLRKAGFGEEIARHLAESWRQRIEWPGYLQTDKPYPDAAVFLQAVKCLPAVVVLLSARQDAAALQSTLEQCGLLPLVQELAVVSPQGAAQRKAAFLRGRAQPGDIMVGDTEADLAAAQAAGLPCLLLDRGFRSRRYWQEQGQDSCAGLQEILEHLPRKIKEE